MKKVTVILSMLLLVITSQTKAQKATAIAVKAKQETPKPVAKPKPVTKIVAKKPHTKADMFPKYEDIKGESE
jgi:hypothetical protein